MTALFCGIALLTAGLEVGGILSFLYGLAKHEEKRHRKDND